MKLYSIFVIVLVLIVSTVQAQDDCLDPSAAKYLVNQALNTQFPDPDSSQVAATITTLYNILRADSSANALNLYLGYDSGHYILVQNCYASAQACFYTTTGYYATVAGYGDQLQRYYAIDSNGGTSYPNNAAPITGDAYNPSARPWYNANGFTAPYSFSNLVGTTGRSYEQTQSGTGAHIASDRLASEPCAGVLANSPAILAAKSLAASNTLGNLSSMATSSVLAGLRNTLQQFQTSANGLATVGLGYNNGIYYDVTDCQGIAASGRAQECDSNRYYGEFVNSAVTGNSNLQVYNFATGATRDTGNAFNTTSRPWFVIGNGFTDPYVFQSGSQSVTSRSYAASFNGGVAFADPNPAFPQDVACPTASMVPSYSYTPTYSPPPSCSTPSPSPSGCSASPSPSGCSGNNGSDDDDVTINFYFADILRGV